MSQRFAVQARVVGLLLVLLLPATGYAQELLAELPHVSGLVYSTMPPLGHPPVSLTFCLVYGVPVFQAATPPSNTNLMPVIGCNELAMPGGLELFVDFHAGNSPQFADLVSTLSNSTREPLWACAALLDS